MRCENPVPGAFWVAIGYKVNDIPWSQFAQQTVQSRKSIPGPKMAAKFRSKPNPEAFWGTVSTDLTIFQPRS
jgi:hypothetical protein